MNTINPPKLPRKISQRLSSKLRAIREVIPPLLFVATFYYLWHMALPLYAKTALLTFVGGGTLLLLGQFFQKCVIEPLQEAQNVLGQVGAALLVYANAADDSMSEDLQQEARRALRGLAGDLAAKCRAQGYYGVLANLEILPAKQSIRESVSDLVIMSECVGTGNFPAFSLALQRIRKALWLEL